MGSPSKLQDYQLCSVHVSEAAKHDVEVAFSNVRRSMSTFLDPEPDEWPYRNKRNGDLGGCREGSFESWFSAS